MSNRDLTRAALASLESANDLAAAVAHFYPEEGEPIRTDLQVFAEQMSQELEETVALSSTPPSAEVRELSAYLAKTATPTDRERDASQPPKAALSGVS
jgi:hypothetical protein